MTVDNSPTSGTGILDIVQVHVPLERHGTHTWRGFCPFHKLAATTTPTFYVHEQRGFFHCFGCGTKGTAVSFLILLAKRPPRGMRPLP